MNTKKIGNLAELQCITRLFELGCSISLPFGDSDKYDAIIDKNNHLYKIQVKHCIEKLNENGDVEYIKFNCYWQGHNSKGYKRNKYSSSDVDLFATFYEGECYLVPQTECSYEKVLRIKPPKNGQLKGVSFLENYKAKEILEQL